MYLQYIDCTDIIVYATNETPDFTSYCVSWCWTRCYLLL